MDDKMGNDPFRNDELILVDGLDRQVGTATKEQAHRDGLLHRAFSVVLTRDKGKGVEIFLAQRAKGKYHSANLWANSCCSHPRSGEEVLQAATRRVSEELGCGVSGLHEIASFVYRVEFEDGLCEYEYDHVLVGVKEGRVSLDPSEVSSVRWVKLESLAKEIQLHPERFAPWAFTVLPLAMAALR